ncbi:MAG: GDP-mannose 4,6-dehydratase [Verrucomicrobia bacterium]|nr:GDP-mannose 4,6-dehydratase [Verrucomicrobiota bacterium]
MKRALITGVTGQDGSYLAELLLEKGYSVLGLVRRSSSTNLKRIEPLLKNPFLQIVEGDLLDTASLRTILQKYSPDEIYNLAAMSHVQSSFTLPEYTMEVNGVSVLRFLEAIRQIVPDAKVYQASTSELFGKVSTSFQNEATPFHPRSPYGIAKLCAFWAIRNYKEAYGLYACNGILFNHESPRRGEEFVSRKISLAVNKIASGKQEKLVLGNLEAKRDWGYAKEFVYGMWQMLQLDKPEDFVLATGKAHTVREFVEKAFMEIGIIISWQGSGVEEKGVDQETGRTLVEVSKEFFRPAEVDFLLGDALKAKEKLGWEPKTTFAELVSLMVKKDQERISFESKDLC